MDKKLSKILIDKDTIDNEVSRLAGEINRDYAGREILLVGLLKGCFVFMSDLMRKITVPCSIDFMIVSSYGSGTQSSGKVNIIRDLSEDIKDKDVIIVEDIVDSGITLDCVMDILRSREPRSLKLCSFLTKPSRRKRDIVIDYCGIEIEDEFVVGYGLDYAEKFRELPYVGVLSD
ncbi:MAG: hypoxanthine phosphoribosyltransferase [Clostridia bacterium]|nr:hypoxanthine phosphoribosyltransferase [Clostridia bacterium]